MTHTFHPLADAYPLMSEADLADLAQSIRANGQREPIYLLGDDILDGRNREAACERAGVEPWYESYAGPTDDDSLRAFIEDKNEHRRHLTPDFLSQRRAERIARVAEKRRAGKSTREIAEAEGVSQPQVLRDLQTAIDTGVSIAPEEGKVERKGGGTYPAKRPQKAPADPAVNGHVEPPEDDPPPGDIPCDSDGVELPEQAREAFNGLPSLRALCREIDQFVKRVEAHGKTPTGLWMRKDSVVADLKRARSTLWQSQPAHVCPYCRGKKPDCTSCKGHGWLTEAAYGAVPKDIRGGEK
jgi:hypothetical protein